MGTRDFLNKSPLMGWGLAAVLAVAAAVLFLRSVRSGETRELTQEVTIRCRETGFEWTMPRGAMEKQLYLRPFPVDPNEGLINPQTGKPTGFPVDDWKATVARVNAERQQATEEPSPGPGGKK